MENRYIVETKPEWKKPYKRAGNGSYDNPMDAMKAVSECFITCKGFGSVTDVRCVRLQDGERKENQWELKIC